jgi:predicted transcriptional regulator of viral defense system
VDYDSLLTLVGEEPVFDSSLLLAGNIDPRLLRIQLSRWVRSGKIIQIRRGLYAIAPPFQKRRPHPFLVANRLQKASYVSLQSALSFYGLIPEVVNVVTSVSTSRPGRVETPLGIYDFRHFKTELLFGYQMIDLGGQSAFVATPEKALLDLIYFQPAGDSVAFLEGLRLQNTEKIREDILRLQAEKFNSPKQRNAVKEILQIKKVESAENEDL